MALGTRFPIAALLALLALLQTCAAPAPALPRELEVTSGRRTRVELADGGSERVFALQNSSSGSRQDIYSDPAGDAMTKVVSDTDLQQLLDVLAAKGLFRNASAAAPPDARDLLIVEADGKRWIWARRLPGRQASEMPFHEAKAYFLTAWNQATAYHAGALRKEDLEAASTRAQRSGDAARRRLEELQAPRNQGPPR